MNYTYMARCRDGTLYTGWTTNLQKRMKAHNLGKGAKYTKSRLPVRLVYYEEYETKQEAQRREYAIKQLTREDKLALIDRLDEAHLEVIRQALSNTGNPSDCIQIR